MKPSADELACLVPDTFEMPPTGAGKLDGKSFVAKDLLSISGHISSFGHPRWRETHTKSADTSPIITRLLKAGAEMKGLAKLDQLAGSLSGNIGEGKAPINSLYPDRFTGGSSSGSASAVAGGLVDFAIGTDTAGSIRVPAAACGIYGLRPTHDSVTSEGVIPLAASFDVVGVFAGSTGLLKDVYRIISKASPEPEPITQVLIPRDCFDIADPAAADTMLKAVRKLAELHDVPIREVKFSPFISQSAADLFSRIQTREAWRTRPDWLRENRRYLSDDLRARMEIAEKRASDSQDVIESDLAARRKYTEDASGIIRPGVLLVLPVIKNLAPLRDATEAKLTDFREMAVRFNAVSSLTGLPEAVIPAASDETGLTYGVGFIGSKNSDMALLDFLS